MNPTYDNARDAAIDSAMKGSIKPSGKGALTPEEKAKCLQLLETYGPPREWSGAVAATLSPEDRALIVRGWKQLSKDERDAVYAKFEAKVEGENVTSPDQETDQEEAAEHGITPENIDAKGKEAAARLDKLLAAGSSKRTSMSDLRDAAVDAAMTRARPK